ncbi:MAG: hypothetical protein ABSG43_23445 [Solirubrobacteraceae bacterium]
MSRCPSDRGQRRGRAPAWPRGPVERDAPAPATRRQLLCSGVLAGACATLTGSLLAPAPTLATSPAPTDAQLLATALGIQQLEVFAYRRLLASSELAAGAAALLRDLLRLELGHAAALVAALTARRAAVPAGPADVAAADRALARHPVAGRLTGTRSQHDCVKLLVDLESVAEGSCYTTIVGLRDSRLAVLIAEVMAGDAQHWTLLDELQHHDVLKAVPGPFVEGTR